LFEAKKSSNHEMVTPGNLLPDSDYRHLFAEVTALYLHKSLGHKTIYSHHPKQDVAGREDLFRFILNQLL